MRLGWVKLLSLSVALVLLTTPAFAAVELSVSVMTPKNYVPVTVVVNGMNIKDLERKYDQLALELMMSKVGMANFATFIILKEQMYNALMSQLVHALEKNDTAKAIKIVRKIGRLDAVADTVLLKFLQSIAPKSSTSMGWFDIYGNHRSFNCTDYYIDPNFDFRLTACYSKIGDSTVKTGETITVKGVLMDRKMIGSRLTIELLDPDSGKLTTLIGCDVGENMTNPITHATISWIGNDFVLHFNTTGLTKGVKELRFCYGNYTVCCCFRIV